MKKNTSDNLHIFETATALYQAAAEFIIQLSNDSVAARGRFSISLSGGNTPEALYSLLSGHPYCEQIPWSKVYVFWGDERCVPLNDSRNNAGRARSMLLDKIPIPSSNIHLIPTDMPPEKAAAVYEKELNSFFGEDPWCFDLVLLGLGENGHTASLFPNTDVIEEQAEGVRSLYLKEEKIFRITMTAPLINRARNLLFLVTGSKKNKILKTILEGPFQPDTYPAQLIRPQDGQLLWFADRAAASSLIS